MQRKKAEAKCFKRFKLNGKVENGKSAQRDSDSKEEEANGLRLSLKEKKSEANNLKQDLAGKEKEARGFISEIERLIAQVIFYHIGNT